jgi:hypothetical protein
MEFALLEKLFTKKDARYKDISHAAAAMIIKRNTKSKTDHYNFFKNEIIKICLLLMFSNYKVFFRYSPTLLIILTIVKWKVSYKKQV